MSQPRLGATRQLPQHFHLLLVRTGPPLFRGLPLRVVCGRSFVLQVLDLFVVQLCDARGPCGIGSDYACPRRGLVGVVNGFHLPFRYHSDLPVLVVGGKDRVLVDHAEAGGACPYSLAALGIAAWLGHLAVCALLGVPDERAASTSMLGARDLLLLTCIIVTFIVVSTRPLLMLPEEAFSRRH